MNRIDTRIYEHIQYIQCIYPNMNRINLHTYISEYESEYPNMNRISLYANIYTEYESEYQNTQSQNTQPHSTINNEPTT